MTLEERLATTPPADSKANTRGVDYTPLSGESSRPEFTPTLDLAGNQKKIKEAKGRELGNGAGGYAPSKPYSDIFK